jgi:RNA polymerase sigma-70 factor (ECF subfamily)
MRVAGNIRAFLKPKCSEKNDMSDKPELQLITDSRNGDRDAMAELFRRHYPWSMAIARRILSAHDESSDAVQSAYLCAFRNFKSFRGDSTFKTWITRIVMNQSLTHVRASARRKHFISLDASVSGIAPVFVRDVAPSPEDLVHSAEIRRKLVETAARLPQPLGKAFHLCAISGLSVAETAKALGITVPATKTRLFRARSFMRSELKNMRQKTNRTCRPETLVCSLASPNPAPEDRARPVLNPRTIEAA